MTNQQILEQAIQKAIDGGWKPEMVNSAYTWCDGIGCVYHDKPQMWNAGESEETVSTNDIIFNHDFAKALWPGASKMNTYTLNEKTKTTDGVNIPLWKYHLQQMVIADDPIKYLGENI